MDTSPNVTLVRFASGLSRQLHGAESLTSSVSADPSSPGHSSPFSTRELYMISKGLASSWASWATRERREWMKRPSLPERREGTAKTTGVQSVAGPGPPKYMGLVGTMLRGPRFCSGGFKPMQCFWCTKVSRGVCAFSESDPTSAGPLE